MTDKEMTPEQIAKKAERRAARKAAAKERKAKVAALSAQALQADASGDPQAALEVYRELAEALKKAPANRSTKTPEERKAARQARREARKRGEYVRQGKPWTDEQRAKQAANWTPERRAAASERSKGRQATPEQIEKLKAAGQARRERQAAMEKRLKELEALVAGGEIPLPADEASAQEAPKRSKRH